MKRNAMPAPKSVLFLDGLGCNPAGYKPRFIAGLGYRVVAPQLPDLDFAAAVEVADRAVAESSPDVIVGYSRGAGVAMMMNDRRTPRFLIAPSLHWIPDGRGFEGRLIVVHSALGDSPLDGIREHLARCGFLGAELRIAGDDHSMIDPDALAAMTAALNELTAEATA